MRRILTLMATVFILVSTMVVLSVLFKKSYDKEVSEEITFNNGNNIALEEETTEVPLYDQLSEEQKKYLKENCGIDEEVVNVMDYEMVNEQLLGTGFELYNLTSGLEKFGTTYKEEKVISDVSVSNELITLSEVTTIRLKEKDIRLDDFANYKYEIVKKDDSGASVMKLPLAEYDNTYVSISFVRNEDSITMEAPVIMYNNGEVEYTFSILYDQMAIKTFFEEEPTYLKEDKIYMDIQYGSITENSLVLKIENWTDSEYECIGYYELYHITNGEETLIDIREGKSWKYGLILGAECDSCYGITFSDTVKMVDGDMYLLKFGKYNKKDEEFIKEIIFEK